MKYSTIILGAAVIAAFALTPTFAQNHQASHHGPNGNEAQERAGAMSCPMMTEDGHGMMDGMMDQMPDGMMQRCHVMMNLDIGATNPAALLALRDELELTSEQVSRLEAIAKEARTEARELLSEEQQAQLKPIADPPEGLSGMHNAMMQMMHHMKDSMMSGETPMEDMPMMRDSGKAGGGHGMHHDDGGTK